MKKIGLLLGIMLLVICVTSTVFADAFTIHSGVVFGMSRDEVQKIESTAGFSTETDDDPLFREDGIVELEIQGNIAGVSDARIEYLFKEDKLTEAVYYLFSKYDNGNYDTFLSSMKNKYGEPNANEIWVAALDSSLMTGRMVATISNSMLGTSIISSKSSVWLLEQEDGSYVSIDLLNINNSNGRSLVYITYASFTKDEVNSILQGVVDGAQEYQQQLNDDL